MLDQFGYPNTFPPSNWNPLPMPTDRQSGMEAGVFVDIKHCQVPYIENWPSVQFEDSHNIQNREGCVACYSFFFNAAFDCDVN
jgi:hypothetical protein